jgi:hypothetical protein
MSMLTACTRSTPLPDVRVPLPDPPARLVNRCDFPTVSVGQDAVQALYQNRKALKLCEGKRRGWQKFYFHVRAKRK